MIEGDVYTLLAPLVDGRCYASTFMQEADLPKWPAIRYTVISEDNEETVCGTDDTSTDDVRVQIDLVAKTHGAALALRDAAIAALMTHEPPPARSSGFQTYDEATKTHRAMVEYVFQQSSAAP
ncbi:MAG: DUF3168 domain-containing protein [Pararhizobium sp.]